MEGKARRRSSLGTELHQPRKRARPARYDDMVLDGQRYVRETGHLQEEVCSGRSPLHTRTNDLTLESGVFEPSSFASPPLDSEFTAIPPPPPPPQPPSLPQRHQPSFYYSLSTSFVDAFRYFDWQADALKHVHPFLPWAANYSFDALGAAVAFLSPLALATPSVPSSQPSLWTARAEQTGGERYWPGCRMGHPPRSGRRRCRRRGPW